MKYKLILIIEDEDDTTMYECHGVKLYEKTGRVTADIFKHEPDYKHVEHPTFRKGVIFKIIDPGKIYSTNTDIFEAANFANKKHNPYPTDNPGFGRLFHLAYHRGLNEFIACLELPNGEQIAININGIEREEE
jgi:hypothetical protein